MFLKRLRRDPDVSPIYGTHAGDLGVIIIAALFTLCLILLLAMPSPIAKYEKAQAQAERARAVTEAKAAEGARKKAIAAAVATGVVSVGLLPDSH